MGKGVGLSVRSGWMMGEGTESALRLYFHRLSLPVGKPSIDN